MHINEHLSVSRDLAYQKHFVFTYSKSLNSPLNSFFAELWRQQSSSEVWRPPLTSAGKANGSPEHRNALFSEGLLCGHSEQIEKDHLLPEGAEGLSPESSILEGPMQVLSTCRTLSVTTTTQFNYPGSLFLDYYYCDGNTAMFLNANFYAVFKESASLQAIQLTIFVVYLIS